LAFCTKKFLLYLDSNTTQCHNPYFIDIVLRNSWTKNDLLQEGWQQKLTTEHPLYFDLVKTYNKHLGDGATFLNRRLQFYNYITYTVLSDDEGPIRIQLRVGDVIDIEEETGEISYARIKAIIRHQANSNHFYAFFVIEWFHISSQSDSILNCPYYDLQEFKNTPWLCIYPITVIDHNPFLHFVHACRLTCSSDHDTKNRQYIRNDFFYHSV